MSLREHPAARGLASPEWRNTARGPAAIPGAILAISAISTGVSAYSAYAQSSAQKQAAGFNADVAKQNEQVAGVQARQAGEAGQAQEDAYNRRLRALEGTQTTQLAATGVDVASGSALDLREDTAGLGAQDIATIRSNTRNSVWQAKLGGVSSADQASLYQSQADTTTPGLAAGASLLGGASSFGSTWYSMYGKRPGG